MGGTRPILAAAVTPRSAAENVSYRHGEVYQLVYSLSATEEGDHGMNRAPLTLEAVKEQFCTEDKWAALEKIRERLDGVLDINRVAELTFEIGKDMDE